MTSDNNRETFETWNNIASLYEEKFMHMDLYNETYDHLCNAIIKHNAKILDIGCGPGNITKYLLTRRPDFDILGIDIAPNMIDLAKKNNPGAHFMLIDSRDINQLNTKFDGIIAGFCLPYLSGEETMQLIEHADALLNENGLIYLSFVEGDPATSGYKNGSGGRVFFNFHPLDGIRNKLVTLQFQSIKIFRVEYKTSDTSFDIHTIVTARKTSQEYM